MSYGDSSGNPNPFSSTPNPYQSSTPGYMPPPEQQGSPVLAIISLVCGVVGIITTCCCGLFGLPIPLAAIICGGIVLAQPNGQGKGMAIGGVALGVLCFIAGIILFIVVLSNPEFMQQLQQMK
ncbi:MAG: DUF4190 domain-containing protein [Pirellulaceae bacterium]